MQRLKSKIGNDMQLIGQPKLKSLCECCIISLHTLHQFSCSATEGPLSSWQQAACMLIGLKQVITDLS